MRCKYAIATATSNMVKPYEYARDMATNSTPKAYANTPRAFLTSSVWNGLPHHAMTLAGYDYVRTSSERRCWGIGPSISCC